MELTSLQISCLRKIQWGKNVYDGNEALNIRAIAALRPELIITTSQIGPCSVKPIFGAVLSREGRRFLDECDAAKK